MDIQVKIFLNLPSHLIHHDPIRHLPILHILLHILIHHDPIRHILLHILQNDRPILQNDRHVRHIIQIFLNLQPPIHFHIRLLPIRRILQIRRLLPNHLIHVPIHFPNQLHQLIVMIFLKY